jgi:hypothetical protein
MGSYPWGPHGPQSGPNQVTPNPTPAYVPPPAPSGGSWAPPAPSYGGGGRGAPNYGGGGGTGAGVGGPRRKGYVLAVILTAIFGPFGLMYITFRGALLMLALLLGTPYTLARMGAYGRAFQRTPLEIIGRDAVMNRWWTLAVMICVVWSVIGVWWHNRKI